MKNRFWNTVFVLLAGASLLLGAGCNNTPTVPLPPPDITAISTTSPDNDGIVTVTGGASAAEADSVVLLYNEDAKSGVMEAAESDGAFEASVAAEPGDTLILQYMKEHSVSYEEFIQVE